MYENHPAVKKKSDFIERFCSPSLPTLQEAYQTAQKVRSKKSKKQKYLQTTIQWNTMHYIYDEIVSHQLECTNNELFVLMNENVLMKCIQSQAIQSVTLHCSEWISYQDHFYGADAFFFLNESCDQIQFPVGTVSKEICMVVSTCNWISQAGDLFCAHEWTH